ncbi:MAG: hypothetical protein ACKOXV_06610 [Bacteroidota bacterium]
MHITNIFADIDDLSTGYSAFVSYGLEEDGELDFIGLYQLDRLIENNSFDSEESLLSSIKNALVRTYPDKKITFDYYYKCETNEVIKRYDESA